MTRINFTFNFVRHSSIYSLSNHRYNSHKSRFQNATHRPSLAQKKPLKLGRSIRGDAWCTATCVPLKNTTSENKCLWVYMRLMDFARCTNNNLHFLRRPRTDLAFMLVPAFAAPDGKQVEVVLLLARCLKNKYKQTTTIFFISSIMWLYSVLNSA